MANEYFQPGEQRAAKVNDLFAGIARRYDLLNDLQSFGLHRRWKRRVVELANPNPGDHALDLCCGTGDLAFALAACGAETTGLDFSEPMLEVAKRRRKEKGERRNNTNADAASSSPSSLLHPPCFIQGDALNLPFPDESFDIVTIGYGLRNLADCDAGLREMQRVARPGARLVVLEFGKPANALWRAAYFTHLRCSVPLVGLLFCGNPQAYAYILESLKHYPGQLAVAEKMRGLKLANIRVVNFLGGAMAINYAEKTV